MITPLLKSVAHNIGVLAVALLLAFIGSRIDALVGWPVIRFPLVAIGGFLLLAMGFLLRVWATLHFYLHQMRVIVLEPQGTLITDGPYRYSRNPLYLGGNVFIFFGAGLLLGSPTMLLFTVLHLPLMDLFVRREERQLEHKFGPAWLSYKSQVRRWL